MGPHPRLEDAKLVSVYASQWVHARAAWFEGIQCCARGSHFVSFLAKIPSLEPKTHDFSRRVNPLEKGSATCDTW